MWFSKWTLNSHMPRCHLSLPFLGWVLLCKNKAQEVLRNGTCERMSWSDDDPWCWWCYDHETQLAIWHHLAWSCMITWSHLHTCDDCAINSSSNVLQCPSKCCCSWKSWNMIWVNNTNSLTWNKALLEIIHPINVYQPPFQWGRSEVVIIQIWWIQHHQRYF